MLKPLSLITLSLSVTLLANLSSIALANDPDCPQFYEDSSGQRTCLENGRPVEPVSPPNYVEFVDYLDQLQHCQPVATAIGFGRIVIEARVQGWEDDRCVVQMNAFNVERPQRRAVYARCRYRRSTLDLMTDERAYEQARTGNITFNSEDSRDMALSDGTLQDCQFSDTWIEELAD